MTKKIKEFNEGEHLTVNLLVNSCTRGVANNGSPYLSLVLQDSSKTIEAKIWDVKPEIEKEIVVGKVYSFTIEVNKYKGNLQAKIINVLPVPQNEISSDDFVIKSPISKNELMNSIQFGINLINNKNIAKIVTAMLKYYDSDVYEYPAATKLHHNFIGGLATHTVTMLKIAGALCDIYPNVNKDYLVAGVIIHDLGKIEEYTSPVVAEYSTQGKLLGHISIMDARLLQIAKELNLDESEELMILRHMVLSHHGELEYGSPTRPQTLEAELLSYIDNIDSKVNIITKALDDTNDGEFTQKLYSLDNRVFYKHK